MTKETSLAEQTERERHSVRMDKRLHKEKDRWIRWKETALKEGIQGVSVENSKLILQYVLDMEVGLNVSAKSCKGARAPRRLNDLKDKLILFSKWFKECYRVDDLSKLTEIQTVGLFHDLREGNLKTKSGKNYKDIGTITNSLKAFWHWYIKVNRKGGVTVEDVTQDLDIKSDKPDWVYLDEKQLFELVNSASFEHKVLILFLIDTGLRPPLELLPIKVSDLYEDCTQLNIRVCKKNSFPRKIKLMLSTELLRQYIRIKNKKPDDFLFSICPEVINRNLKKYALNLFGDVVTLAGHKYSQITMYDLRHNSCCYWLSRYKSESGLKFRFGWKKSEKIHYYSELLGMKDTISEEDLLDDVTKTELENRLKKVEHENLLWKEKVVEFEKYMKLIDEISKKIEGKLI